MHFRLFSVRDGSSPGLLELLHLDEVADVAPEDTQLVGLVEGLQLVR